MVLGDSSGICTATLWGRLADTFASLAEAYDSASDGCFPGVKMTNMEVLRATGITEDRGDGVVLGSVLWYWELIARLVVS